jgi:hypothetical protein
MAQQLLLVRVVRLSGYVLLLDAALVAAVTAVSVVDVALS